MQISYTILRWAMRPHKPLWTIMCQQTLILPFFGYAVGLHNPTPGNEAVRAVLDHDVPANVARAIL